MIFSDFKYILNEEDRESLKISSFLTKEQVNDLTTDRVVRKNLHFGRSEKDFVEVGVYTTDGNLIATSYINGAENDSIKRFIPVTSSYIDVNNEKITYSYNDFVSNFVVLNNQSEPVSSSIFVDVEKVFTDLEIQDGNYIVSFTPTRDVVGNRLEEKQKLVVNEISPSRREISVIPNTNRSSTNLIDVALNDEFELFNRSAIKPRYIDDELFSKLNNAQFYVTYLNVVENNTIVADQLKFFYSFKTDTNLINFINDIYVGVQSGKYNSAGFVSNRKIDGIFDQFKKTLLSNYDSITTFQEIKDVFFSLFSFILNKELNQITNRKPTEYNSFIEFFTQIIYEQTFLPVINDIEQNYESVFYGYLRNSVYFEDGRTFQILNKATKTSTNTTYHDRLILKFIDPLPTNYQVGDVLWISNNTISLPVFQSVYYYSENVISTFSLRGPNFNIKSESTNNSTKDFSINTIVDEQDENYNELMSRLEYKQNKKDPLNVDYTKFENFIKFSSAGVRLNVYSQKIKAIDDIKDQLINVEENLLSNPVDKYYLLEQEKLNSDYNLLENSFDGYEDFLYKNPVWYNEHTKIISGVASASRYDDDNADSLYSSLPAIITENFDNYEYMHFVNMIGHYFDNLTLYINQFTQKNNTSNAELEGVSKDIVYEMLSSLGWDSEIGKDNLPLILSSFSKDDFEIGTDLYNQAYVVSEKDRTKLIWKRILNNLPYILKEKGTISAIDSLINCFGVPRNLLQIKEFGGIEFDSKVENDSFYQIEETKYSPIFSGSGEYFELPWSNEIQTLQFDFSFDKNKINEEGQVFRLISASGSAWVIGATRSRGTEQGKMFFSLRDSTNTFIKSFVTEKAPIFNGDVYSVFLKKYKPNEFFQSTTVKENQYPNQYELIVIRSDEERITFQTSASIFLSGSYNNVFKNAEKIYAGNYLQNTSSLEIDPEAFYGTLDEIKGWTELLTNETMFAHSIYKGSYSSENPNQVIDKNLIRITFDSPIDLHTTGSYVEVKNSAFNKSLKDIRAYNFPQYFLEVEGECEPQRIPAYPYQFKKINFTQSSRVPNFGSNKFRGNKVKYKTQRLVANLSPSTKSTIDTYRDSQIDSNKLGVFISPTNDLNEEIIKFFGGCEFGNLIGDPRDVHRKNYKKFNEFRKIFFNQGFGNLDYQTFINYVRSYFDKSLFKYIEKLVPHRTSIVSGILIEPSILERPKLEIKAPKQQNIRVDTGEINQKRDTVNVSVVNQLSSELVVASNGLTVYEDEFGSFYPDRLDPYGFSILGNNGISFYEDDYYRVEIVKVKKSYTVLEKKPSTATIVPSNLKRYIPNHQTIEKFYDQLSISKFPIVTKIPGFVLTRADMVFSGEIIGDVSGKITSLPSNLNQNFVFSGSFYNLNDTGEDMISGSGADATSGSFLNQNTLLGIEGRILPESLISLNQTVSGEDEYRLIATGSIAASFYTLDNSQIFDYLIDNSTGFFFSNIRDSAFNYRFNISQQNKPEKSVPLDGYYLTHYRSKKPMNEKNKIITKGSLNIRTGIFKKNFQTQKTTVDSLTGLTNNTSVIETFPFVSTEIIEGAE